MSEEKFEIERVAIPSAPGEKVTYSPYGYVIDKDGTVYALTQQYTHGVIIAILYPDFTKKHGYEPPDEDFDVFEYQRLELDHSRELDIIRVSMRLYGDLNFSKGKTPANQEQITSISTIIKGEDLTMADQVVTEKGQMSVREFMNALHKGVI